MISALFCAMVVVVGSAAAGREIDDELGRIQRGERPAEDEVRRQWDQVTGEARSRWDTLRTRSRNDGTRKRPRRAMIDDGRSYGFDGAAMPHTACCRRTRPRRRELLRPRARRGLRLRGADLLPRRAGGVQTRPFIVYPSHLELPPGPILGPRACTASSRAGGRSARAARSARCRRTPSRRGRHRRAIGRSLGATGAQSTG
jgi:hypothetical protein